MGISETNVSQASFHSLLERYQHRVLTLEIELRQMAREGVISPVQYKKRVLILKGLKNQVRELHQAPNPSLVKQESAALFLDAPNQHNRSPEETVVCLQFFEECFRLSHFLLHECKDILDIVRKAILGRTVTILSSFDLSRIKKKLVKLEQYIQDFEQKKNSWKEYVDNILQFMQMPEPYKTSLSNLQILKNRFFEIDKLNKEILSLGLEVEKAEDELEMMVNWLSFQEWRISQYFPKGMDTGKKWMLEGSDF